MAEPQNLPFLHFLKTSPISQTGSPPSLGSHLVFPGQGEGAFEETIANSQLLASVSHKNKGELASVPHLSQMVSIHLSLVVISFLVVGSKFLAFAAPKYLLPSRSEIKVEKLHCLSPGSIALRKQRNIHSKSVNLTDH